MLNYFTNFACNLRDFVQLLWFSWARLYHTVPLPDQFLWLYTYKSHDVLDMCQHIGSSFNLNCLKDRFHIQRAIKDYRASLIRE